MKYYAIFADSYGDWASDKYGYSTKQIPMFDTAKAANQAAERMAKANPGIQFHIMETSGLISAKPGPVERQKVNEKGEVLPA